MHSWPCNLGYLGTWAQARLGEMKTTELAMYAYDEGTGVDRRRRLLVATELGILEVVAALRDGAAPFVSWAEEATRRLQPPVTRGEWWSTAFQTHVATRALVG